MEIQANQFAAALLMPLFFVDNIIGENRIRHRQRRPDRTLRTETPRKPHKPCNSESGTCANHAPGDNCEGIVVYDIDTTGDNAPFDQILHFAAILTDNELNELERFDIRTRLLPHLIPNPEVLLLRRTTVDKLTDPALPSFYDAICTIRRTLLSWSPAVFIGYNSYRCDEHFLRHSFYKTLHPPYLTNTNGNTRTDAMRMAQATSVFFPNRIVIPVDRAGRQTFDLLGVARANGFYSHNARDALSDAEATAHICRLLMDRTPGLWSTFMRFSQKAAVRELH